MKKSKDEIKTVIVQSLHHIAPEVDLEQIDPDAELQEEIELDSMDFLRFMLQLNEALKVDIPEKDYVQFSTLNRSIDYLDKIC